MQQVFKGGPSRYLNKVFKPLGGERTSFEALVNFGQRVHIIQLRGTLASSRKRDGESS